MPVVCSVQESPQHRKKKPKIAFPTLPRRRLELEVPHSHHKRVDNASSSSEDEKEEVVLRPPKPNPVLQAPRQSTSMRVPPPVLRDLENNRCLTSKPVGMEKKPLVFGGSARPRDGRDELKMRSEAREAPPPSQHAVIPSEQESVESRQKAEAVRKGEAGRRRAMALGQVSDNFVKHNANRKGTYRKRARPRKKETRTTVSYDEFSVKARSSTPDDGDDDDDGFETCLEALRKQGRKEKPGLDDETRFVMYAPRCGRHGTTAKLLRVKKKSTGNHDRPFYACPEEGCDFFKWADDHAPVVAANSRARRPETEDEWRRRISDQRHAQRKLRTIQELADEATRRGLSTLKKKKTDLLATLREDDRLRLGRPPRAVVDSPPETSTSSCEPNEDDFDEEEPSVSEEDDDDDDEIEVAPSAALEAAIVAVDSDDDDQSLEIDGFKSNTDRVEPRVALRSVFGHENFRDGQEWAIARCLDGKSSLLVLPTGSGKSLCYQLPACLVDGLVVVVSPLVALIEEQMARMPPEIPCVTLSGSSASLERRLQALEDAKTGRAKIVFTSPERLSSRALKEALAGVECGLFVVDEAHCVSQWSHNFRPAFLKIGRAAREILRPKAVLALTATASERVTRDICEVLGMDSRDEAIGGDVSRSSWRRSNLELCVARVDGACADDEEGRKLEALVGLVKSSTTTKEDAIIVYVHKQHDAERVAEQLVARGYEGVRAYHAGLASADRARVARDFARGKVRIVLATVAFGMGVDKADVRRVVHWTMPSSLERYVQEIGRAGRDGEPAKCVCLLSVADFRRLAALARSDGIELSQVRSLLQRVFVGRCWRPLSLEACGRDLDVKPQVLETIVALFEKRATGIVCGGRLMDGVRIRIRRNYDDDFSSTAGDARPRKTSEAQRLLLALLDQRKFARDPSNDLLGPFSLCAAAEARGLTPWQARRELEKLRTKGVVDVVYDNSSLLFRAGGDVDISALSRDIHAELSAIEEAAIDKLCVCFRALELAAIPLRPAKEASEKKKSTTAVAELLALEIDSYFDADGPVPLAAEGAAVHTLPSKEDEDHLCSTLLALATDPRLSGAASQQSRVSDELLADSLFLARATTRILHALSSPAFPSQEWRESPFWGAFSHVPFTTVLQAARRHFSPLGLLRDRSRRVQVEGS